MRDYDKFELKRRHVFKEDVIDGLKVKIRQRFDEHGGYMYDVQTKSVVKNEGERATSVVVECFYREDSENWINYMGELQHSPDNIRSLIQIRLLNSKNKTCRTFQIYGTPNSYRDRGIIQITNTGRTMFINEDYWEFAEIIRFIQNNFDKFTKDWVNLNLEKAKTIEGIESTPKEIIKLMGRAKDVRNTKEAEAYFYT